MASKSGRQPIDVYGATETLQDPSWATGSVQAEENCELLSFQPRESDSTPVKHFYCFNDGRRQIDFVLVYEKNFKKQENGKDEEYRKKYLKKLKRNGLELEEEVEKDSDKETVFIKVHANFETLCKYAEELCIKAPLQAHPNPSRNFSDKVLAAIKIPNIMIEEVENKPLDYYTCTFRRNKFDKFLGSEDPDNFFSNRDRSRVANEILQTTEYGRKTRAEIGIDQLLGKGVFTAAFPLHDGPYSPKNTSPQSMNPRQTLHRHWGRWGKWYKYQPLDNIKEYFGEKIALYFAWLGFYTAWLLPATLVGVLVFAYGVITMFDYQPANTVCGGGEFLMCPLCDVNEGCKAWYLNVTCMNYRLSHLFDHGGTVFYAVFMSFWAVSFLEYWKRKNVSLAHHWDCLGYEDEEERPRPEFTVKAKKMEENPVTGVMEPSFPSKQRLPRLLTSFSAIIIMVFFVIIFIMAVILYRAMIRQPLFANDQLRSYTSLMTSMTAAVFNLILIMVLSNVYSALAVMLTDWEMHRTQTEYEDNLILKVFVFQFCNFYSSLVYIGFFKGRFVGYPGHYTKFLGLRNEECGPGGCFMELAQQLGVILIGKQCIGNIQEIVIPKIKGFIWRMKQKKKGKGEEKPWERDYQLIGNDGLFQEYLEMVLQFGFITIFVAAFPLAPLFALINNWMEIRLDASKFVTETRRPVAEKAEDIGVWFAILDSLATLAVIFNAFLIAFTSTFLDQTYYSYFTGDTHLKDYINFTLSYSLNDTLSLTENGTCRYRGYRDVKGMQTPFDWQLLVVKLAFVIAFEHVVFFVCRMIDVLVPDIPESLQIKIKKESFLAKKALAESEGQADRRSNLKE